MTYAQFASLVRFNTKTNSTSFPDSEILLLANISKDKIAGLVANHVGEDFFGQRLTTNLVADQREYALPAEMLGKIKYAEAKLDGTNWKKLYGTDLSQYDKPTDETTIRSTFAALDPAIDIFDNALFIYSNDPIINVTAGLKIWAIVFPADWTDLTLSSDISANPSTTSHGIPKQFHELIARDVSITWKTSQPRPIPLSAKEQTFEVDLQRELENLRVVNLDEEITVSLPFKDSFQY